MLLRNHDVKAVEYYLKAAFATSTASRELLAISEFTHFACTSEAVSNLAYACRVSEVSMTWLPIDSQVRIYLQAVLQARQHTVIPLMRSVVDSVASVAEDLADVPLLARTHGQPATPTTMGKEFVNFAHRLDASVAAVANTKIRGKVSVT